MASAATPGLLHQVGSSKPGTIIGLIAAGLVLTILYRVIYNLFFHPLRNYPGPLLWRISRIPLDIATVRGTFSTQLLQFHRQYGYTVRVGPEDLSFANAEAYRDVLSLHPGKEEFAKDSRRVLSGPNGIHSILIANKENHARYRRLLAHAFSEKGLRDQEPRIREYVNLMVDRLKEKTETGEATDIVDWYTMTVFDVIGELAFGASFNGLQDRKVHEWIPAILANVKFALQAAVWRQRGLDSLQSYLVTKDVVAGRVRNYALAQERIDQRIAYGGEARGDFWDRILIKSADDNAKGEGMSKGEMLVNASVLILAGAETSATALSGSTLLLLQNPDKLSKAVQEVRSTFESGDDIDVYSVNRLVYLNAVLEESMRFYPPAPVILPRTSPRGGGMVNGKFIPENTTIHLSQMAAARLATNFHRPDDFVPERWLADPPSEFAGDNRLALVPFSLGTRNCIGQNLAYAEMRLILAKVLYHFDLQLSGEQKGDWFDQRSFGVRIKPPQYVKLSLARV